MRRHYIIAIGICGSLLSVVADLFLAFFPQGVYGFENIFTVDIRLVFPVFSQATHTRLLFSNFFAMIGIPLGWFGLYYVFLNLRQEEKSRIFSQILIIGGAIGYLCGTLFHVSLSYIATAFRIQRGADAIVQVPLSNMIDRFVEFSQPLAYIFLLVNIIISAIFFMLVISKNSKFPVWSGVLNPFVIQLLVAVFTSFMPLPIKTFLIVSVYNFSLLLFYLLCYYIPKQDLQRNE